MNSRCDEGSPSQINNSAKLLSPPQPRRQLQERTLSHSVQEHVGLGIKKDRASDLVFPEIVMRKPAQAGLDPSKDDRHVPPYLLESRGIHDAGAIGPRSVHIARSVRIVVTQFSRRGIVGNHRIHRSGRDPEKESWPAERLEWLWRAPVGLRDDPDPIPMRLKPAGQDRYTERRVVNVRITGNEDHIQLIPTASMHFFTCSGETRHGASLRIEAESLQGEGFRKAAHDIHVLNSLSRSPLYEIVDCGHDDDFPGPIVEGKPDIAEISPAHKSR